MEKNNLQIKVDGIRNQTILRVAKFIQGRLSLKYPRRNTIFLRNEFRKFDNGVDVLYYLKNQGVLDFEHTRAVVTPEDYEKETGSKTKEKNPAIDTAVNVKLKITFEEFCDYMEKLRLNPLRVSDKIKLSISKENGIYINQDNKKPNYPISGNRANLLRILKNGKIDGNTLANAQNQKLSVTIKEIKEINKNFRKFLLVNENLIIHIETGGYRLNNEKFGIEFVD